MQGERDNCLNIPQYFTLLCICVQALLVALNEYAISNPEQPEMNKADLITAATPFSETSFVSVWCLSPQTRCLYLCIVLTKTFVVHL